MTPTIRLLEKSLGYHWEGRLAGGGLDGGLLGAR